MRGGIKIPISRLGAGKIRQVRNGFDILQLPQHRPVATELEIVGQADAEFLVVAPGRGIDRRVRRHEVPVHVGTAERHLPRPGREAEGSIVEVADAGPDVDPVG